MSDLDHDTKRTLFIRELADEVDKDILYSAFIPFGTVVNIHIPHDKVKGTNKGIAFVEFDSPEDAKHALYNRHESELYGRVIKVSYSTRSHLRQVNAQPFRAVWHNNPEFGRKPPEDENEENDKGNESNENKET
ncbi:bifunctional RNA recognition motif domain/Nucleotide-binding alpha-beta plait domain superfamily/RNA-binding domain superfamily [Babesia duncani]|uniref:Bifunctional RNA recognition motif domain/Nucleotide-binding alpha-beta plait domain superfamily/RNA-binding domain superfamily n=1 Tax=Babesia duncani TaxID=323732 RepID=A0AAD9PM68_9APIC|nr:bifunctional RNA recognition motif domain/Nucleotide-binding alpha-beta plait domain superfamily/RNA-binding domain superfamily [Babesia duncani]